MDGRAKKRLEVIKQKLQLLKQKLAGAKRQDDEPGEVKKARAGNRHARGRSYEAPRLINST
jgi:hypothetical protein